MDFYISLNTENLGQIKLSLKVRNKRVYVDFDGTNMKGYWIIKASLKGIWRSWDTA